MVKKSHQNYPGYLFSRLEFIMLFVVACQAETFQFFLRFIQLMNSFIYREVHENTFTAKLNSSKPVNFLRS